MLGSRSWARGRVPKRLRSSSQPSTQPGTDQLSGPVVGISLSPFSLKRARGSTAPPPRTRRTPAAARRPAAGERSWKTSGTLRLQRQGDDELREPPLLRLDADAALVHLHDDVVADGQPQARSLARALGGE